jgi:hypothetical protein
MNTEKLKKNYILPNKIHIKKCKKAKITKKEIIALNISYATLT